MKSIPPHRNCTETGGIDEQRRIPDHGLKTKKPKRGFVRSFRALFNSVKMSAMLGCQDCRIARAGMRVERERSGVSFRRDSLTVPR